MASAQVRTFIRNLCRATGRGGLGALPDAELLRRFAAGHDEAAFEVLVWRHGATVLGVCERILHRPQDAEDAFQATFLAFVREAGSIGKRDAVGSWLYKVAYRVALKAKATAAKRAGEQRTGPEPRAAPAGDELLWRDLRPVLDSEVNRLPEKYRRPFVLCYLEGMTCAEAARELGCPRGTVVTRLARARERLRARLARRGIGLPAAALGATLGRNAAVAAVPPGLLWSTVSAGLAAASGAGCVGPASPGAVALARGVAKVAPAVKLWTAAVCLVFGAAAGVSALTSPERAELRPASPADPSGSAAHGRQVGEASPARMGGMDDSLPVGARARFGSLRFRTGGGYGSVAYAPGGRTLAFGGALWDAATGRRVARLQERAGDHVSLPVFSPDGKALAAGGFSPDERGLPAALICLWDAETGAELRRLTAAGRRPVCHVAFSADGRTLAALGAWAGGGQVSWDGTLARWDVESGRLIGEITVGPPAGMSARLAPGAKTVVAWAHPPADARTAAPRRWDAETGEELPPLRGEAEGVAAVAFSADAGLVVAAGRDLALWDAGTGEQRFRVHGCWARAVAFSSDGTRIATRGLEGSVRLWDVAAGRELRRLPGRQEGVSSPPPVFSPDGKTLATESEGALCLWDVETGREHFPADGHYGPVTAVAFCSGGRLVVSGGKDAAIRLWDRVTGRAVGELARAPWDVLALTALPGGKTLAACGHDAIDASARILDMTTGEELRRVKLRGFGSEPETPAAFSPGGKILAAGWRGGLALWDAGSGERLREWTPAELGVAGNHGGRVLAVAFAPDGTLAAATAESIRLWDPAGGQPPRTIAGPFDPRRSGLAFSADGGLLACSSYHPAGVQVWDVASGREIPGCVPEMPAPPHCLAFAPDGEALLTGHKDTTLLLWDLTAVRRARGRPAMPEPPTSP
jgi:RNA polymerase sigma factor (sigma-70 family)